MGLTMAEDDYNYKKAYLREKSARDQLETLLEDKTRALFIANQELEEKLETVKKQQVTLMQSEKMATLGTLSAGVAHEIKNPLAYITSNVASIKFIKPVLVTLMKATQQFVDKSISVSMSSEFYPFQSNHPVSRYLSPFRGGLPLCI